MTTKLFKEETRTENKENEVLRHEIGKMKKVIKEQAETISFLKKGQTKLVDEMTNKIKSQSKKISSLEAQLSSFQQRIGSLVSAEISITKPGILANLKEKQKTPFDRYFVASQSSNDIYNLLVPRTDDIFTTNDEDSFFIEFQLEAKIMITGVRIYSSDSCFPRSFDIAVDGETVKSVKDARELNGKLKEMTVNFIPVRGRIVRFIQTGPNWDKGSNFLNIKGFELLSSESKYSKGVFATLVNESKSKDQHKCPVVASAYNFDFNRFHSIDTKSNIYTFGFKNSWFQIELTRGTAVLSGFRLMRCNPEKIRNFKLICTNDPRMPESSWTKLIEINEKTEKEHKVIDIYEFPNPSPPTKFVRIVQTGHNWVNDDFLVFQHFDLFGFYF
ncbi:hypothetical protein M9Y10_045731 [Tritrichomonas musculus]|uniref:F5/8 type C domain-containing protein n=1 Tax=Tritrichomonas musculus TaxID=1915356 RepID=A0ABR2JX68_9EUKA